MKPHQVSFVFSLTALILYIPANYLPFMTIEMYGRRNSSTIWDGIVSLHQTGSTFVAFVVLAASLIIPFIKIVLLLYLAWCARVEHFNKAQKKMYHILEVIGRWSMLDIFLVAILVGLLKLGKWADVKAEPGALLFCLVVIFTLISSDALGRLKEKLHVPENDLNHSGEII